MRVSPLTIQLLLHIHTTCEPIPNHYFPAQVQVILKLLREGIIYRCPTSQSGYRTTERGDAWVREVCSTPYPEAVWTDPRKL